MPIIKTDGGFIYKKTAKNAGFGRAKFLLIIFLCSIVVATGCLYLFPQLNIASFLRLNRYVIFDAKTYYIVYVDRGENYNDISDVAQSIKLKGGAGYVLNFDNNYYVVAGCYSILEDANAVKENLISYNTDVLCLNFDRLIISADFSSEQITTLKHCISLVNSAFENLYDVVLSLDRGEILDAEARQKLQVFKELCLEDKETLNRVFQNNFENIVTRVKIFQSEVISNYSMLLLSKNLSSDIKYSMASILNSFLILQNSIKKWFL